MSGAAVQRNKQERAGRVETVLGLIHYSVHHPLVEVVNVKLLGIVLRQKNQRPVELREAENAATSAAKGRRSTCSDMLTPARCADAYPGLLYVERELFRSSHSKFLGVKARV
jgi:hypothetical protein